MRPTPLLCAPLCTCSTPPPELEEQAEAALVANRKHLEAFRFPEARMGLQKAKGAFNKLPGNWVGRQALRGTHRELTTARLLPPLLASLVLLGVCGCSGAPKRRPTVCDSPAPYSQVTVEQRLPGNTTGSYFVARYNVLVRQGTGGSCPWKPLPGGQVSLAHNGRDLGLFDVGDGRLDIRPDKKWAAWICPDKPFFLRSDSFLAGTQRFYGGALLAILAANTPSEPSRPPAPPLAPPPSPEEVAEQRRLEENVAALGSPAAIVEVLRAWVRAKAHLRTIERHQESGGLESALRARGAVGEADNLKEARLKRIQEAQRQVADTHEALREALQEEEKRREKARKQREQREQEERERQERERLAREEEARREQERQRRARAAIGVPHWAEQCTDIERTSRTFCSQSSAYQRSVCRRNQRRWRKHTYYVSDIFHFLEYNSATGRFFVRIPHTLISEEWEWREFRSIAGQASGLRNFRRFSIRAGDLRVAPEDLEESLHVDALVRVQGGGREEVRVRGGMFDVQVIGLRAYTDDYQWSRMLISPPQRVLRRGCPE